MKFMVWVMCAMSSHFTRQIRWVAIRAAVNDVLQGSTWSFTAFHKSVPTSFRRESLKRNHGNYMFAQGKWNGTFPSVLSFLLSPLFFFGTLFTLLLWPTTIYPIMLSFDSRGKTFCPVHPDRVSIYRTLFTDMWCTEKKSARLRLERQI